MFDSESIKKLLQLPDDELRKKVSEAAIAAGADKYMSAMVLSDMTKLRTMLGTLSEEQIRSLMSQVNPNTVNEIKQRIEGKSNG